MEKDQKPLVDGMLRTTFREVLTKSIVTLLIGRTIGSLYGSLSVDPYVVGLSPEAIAHAKDEYFKRLLVQAEVKQDVLRDLESIKRMRNDLVMEILSQYGMDKSDESTYYHDFLCQLFEIEIWNVSNMVRRDKWKELLG